MSFLGKLFGKKKTQSEPMRGLETAQSKEQVDHTRANMEAEMDADRSRRQDASKQELTDQ